MSADIDINERLWITVRANGSLELNMLHDSDIVETVVEVLLDPRKAKDRKGLEILKGTIEHCLSVSKPIAKEEN